MKDAAYPQTVEVSPASPAGDPPGGAGANGGAALRTSGQPRRGFLTDGGWREARVRLTTGVLGDSSIGHFPRSVFHRRPSLRSGAIPTTSAGWEVVAVAQPTRGSATRHRGPVVRGAVVDACSEIVEMTAKTRNTTITDSECSTTAGDVAMTLTMTNPVPRPPLSGAPPGLETHSDTRLFSVVAVMATEVAPEDPAVFVLGIGLI